MPTVFFRTPDGRVSQFETTDGATPQQAARLAGAQGLSANYANDRSNQLGFANAFTSADAAQQAAQMAAAPFPSPNPTRPWENFQFQDLLNKGLAAASKEDFAAASKDIAAGAIKGASNIGATLLTPIDAAARAVGVQNSWIGRDDRREAVDAFMQSSGRDTEGLPYATGTIGAELAGVSGVGGLLAKPVSLLAPNLGAAAPAAARTAAAIRSFGLTVGAPPATTMIGKAADLGFRVAGGLVAGVPAWRLIDPYSTGTIKKAIVNPLLNFSRRMANEDFSGKLQSVLSNNAVKVDEQFLNELAQNRQIAERELGLSPGTLVNGTSGISNQVEEAIRKAGPGGVIDGQTAYNIWKALDAAGSSNPYEAYYARGLKVSLVNALYRSLGPDQADAFSTDRRHFRNLMALENFAQRHGISMLQSSDVPQHGLLGNTIPATGGLFASGLLTPWK